MNIKASTRVERVVSFLPVMKRQVFKLILANALIFTSPIIYLTAQSTTISGNDITAIHTDFGGYFFSSTTSVSGTEPNDAHDLIGFEFDGTTYSTGVNDTELTNQGVTFTAGNYEIFTPTTATANQAGIGSNEDGDTGSLTPIYATGSTNVSDYITDGTKGLGMSTFANNVGGTFVFSLSSIDDATVGDGIPDILYFNCADPSSTPVRFIFRNSSGTQIGYRVRTNEGSARPTIANIRVDRYETLTGNQSGNLNAQKSVEGFALEFSDFDNGSFNLKDAVSLEIELPTQADPPFIAYYTPAFSALLPVDLSSFEVQKEENRVLLNWQTESETNNAFFEIQRSLDASNWETIDLVDGAGTTTVTQKYTFTDSQPLTNTSYYRLKQVDYDGKNTYSQVRSIFIAEQSKVRLTVFPQPASEILFIESTVILAPQDLSLMNSYGVRQKVLFRIRNEKGLEVDISRIPPGIYFLVVLSEGRAVHQKVVVQ